MAPMHETMTVMACQIIQNEQHTQGRIHSIQLLCRWKWVPILPSSPFWNLFWSGWTGLENGGQFPLEPGMQDRIRALLDWLGTKFPSGRSKQGEEFARLATNILMILGRWLSLWLKAETWMGNGLIRSCFILTPQW